VGVGNIETLRQGKTLVWKGRGETPRRVRGKGKEEKKVKVSRSRKAGVTKNRVNEIKTRRREKDQENARNLRASKP